VPGRTEADWDEQSPPRPRLRYGPQPGQEARRDFGGGGSASRDRLHRRGPAASNAARATLAGRGSLAAPAHCRGSGELARGRGLGPILHRIPRRHGSSVVRARPELGPGVSADAVGPGSSSRVSSARSFTGRTVSDGSSPGSGDSRAENPSTSIPIPTPKMQPPTTAPQNAGLPTEEKMRPPPAPSDAPTNKPTLAPSRRRPEIRRWIRNCCLVSTIPAYPRSAQTSFFPLPADAQGRAWRLAEARSSNWWRGTVGDVLRWRWTRLPDRPSDGSGHGCDRRTWCIRRRGGQGGRLGLGFRERYRDPRPDRPGDEPSSGFKSPSMSRPTLSPSAVGRSG
jgi:hypothetical protein